MGEKKAAVSIAEETRNLYGGLSPIYPYSASVLVLEYIPTTHQ